MYAPSDDDLTGVIVIQTGHWTALTSIRFSPSRLRADPGTESQYGYLFYGSRTAMSLTCSLPLTGSR
jgi:hypothetical protein